MDNNQLNFDYNEFNDYIRKLARQYKAIWNDELKRYDFYTGEYAYLFMRV